MKQRVKLLLLVMVLVFVTVFGAACSSSEDASSSDMADMVLKNGVIYTVDDESSVAESVAIKDGTILAVGTTEEIEKLEGDDTEVTDLEGKMVLPGMIDSHIHPMVMELAKNYKVDLSGAESVDDLMTSIEEYVEDNPDLDAWYGDLFSVGLFEGEEVIKGPKKERLDEISTEKPIVIMSNDGFFAWMNTKAFEEAGITAETENPIGGEIIKSADGELWGTLKSEAVKMAPPQEFTQEEKVFALKEFQSFINSLGYTGIYAVPYMYEVPAAEFKEMDDNGELSLRVNGATGIYEGEDLTEQFDAAEELSNEYSDGNVRMNAVKFFADGAVEALSADFLEPYEVTDDDGNPANGYTRFSYDLMEEAFKEANSRGLQIHVHSIGDKSTQEVLNNLETTKAEDPEGDYRNSITHLQLVAEPDKPRFKELDVVAVPQVFWHFKEPDWYEVVDEPFLGTERAEAMYPLKSLLDAGACIASASDHAVTADPDPFWAIETGVTRNIYDEEYFGVDEITDMDDPEYLLNKDERITVEDMIRTYTINGAYHQFREDEVGSIEMGKFADLIVVDQDITAIDPVDISKTKVLMTIFNGKIVYEQE